MTDVPFDQAVFRQALGRFPTGVAVVTARTMAGERLGMTVSSFNSVSLAPPLVLFSVARRTSNFSAWQAVQHYAVNILSEDQEALSDRFSRPGPDRWAGLTVEEGRAGAPILAEALAVLECDAYARYEGGDHEIFVGQVKALAIGPAATPRPLVFFSGRYHRLAGGEAHVAPSDSLFQKSWSGDPAGKGTGG